MALPQASRRFLVDQATPKVVVAALRGWLPERSWSQIRRLLSSRRVTIGGALCLFENRRLRLGEAVAIYDESLPTPPRASDVAICYLDDHLAIVEKPARMTTLRHKAERHWPSTRKSLQPTLDEAVSELLSAQAGDRRCEAFSVHRIDRDTSGLVVFARHRRAQEALIEQFAAHSATRLYRALALGEVEQATFRSYLVRDRGDGLRGSHPNGRGRHAITHVRPLRKWRRQGNAPLFTEIECRLETGRTHQIRIHMAESERPLCGDPRYRGRLGAVPVDDLSEVPRLALHAAELGIVHPVSGETIHRTSPWPADMRRYFSRLVEVC